MRAVYAEAINPEDPLKGLVVGERPDPEPAKGWTRVAVTAASLSHEQGNLAQYSDDEGDKNSLRRRDPAI